MRHRKQSVRVPAHVRKLIQSKDIAILDLGGAQHPTEGAIVMDVRKNDNVHVVHDWDEYPWPFPDRSMTAIIASHVVEHVNPLKFGFIKWMDECWRIMKTGGQLAIVAPYAGSPGYWADPTHVNPCTEHTWRYFDPSLSVHGDLYHLYRPKPWKIQHCSYQINGNMDVVLVKIEEAQ